MTSSYAAMHRAEFEAGDPRATGAYMIVSLLGLAVTIFMASVVAVGITRQVLGQGSSGVVLYFAAGRTEWRMLAANVRYLLAIFAMQATMHVPLNPKSDLVFFYTLANLIIQKNGVDLSFVENNTQGFEEFKKFIADYSLSVASKVCGITEEEINKLADLIVKGKRVSFWWTMGVNQSHEGVRLAQSIINLALMTGNIGKPGTGANSITGQCNAMGSRLFSNTTNLLGGRDFMNAEHRQAVADILNFPLESKRAIHFIDKIMMPRINKLHKLISTNNKAVRIEEGSPRYKHYYNCLTAMGSVNTYYITHPPATRPPWFSI